MAYVASMAYYSCNAAAIVAGHTKLINDVRPTISGSPTFTADEGAIACATYVAIVGIVATRGAYNSTLAAAGMGFRDTSSTDVSITPH